MRTYWISFLFLSLIAGSACGQNIHPPYVLKRFEYLKTPPKYLQWQKIPWVTDLSDGVELAMKENRPMLLWGSDDNPLDRC